MEERHFCIQYTFLLIRSIYSNCVGKATSTFNAVCKNSQDICYQIRNGKTNRRLHGTSQSWVLLIWTRAIWTSLSAYAHVIMLCWFDTLYNVGWVINAYAEIMADPQLCTFHWFLGIRDQGSSPTCSDWQHRLFFLFFRLFCPRELADFMRPFRNLIPKG